MAFMGGQPGGGDIPTPFLNEKRRRWPLVVLVAVTVAVALVGAVGPVRAALVLSGPLVMAWLVGLWVWLAHRSAHRPVRFDFAATRILGCTSPEQVAALADRLGVAVDDEFPVAFYEHVKRRMGEAAAD